MLVGFAYVLDGLPTKLDALVILSGVGIVARLGRRNDVGGPITLSLLSVILLAAVPLLGPVGAAAVGILGAIPSALRLPVRALAFNTGMYAVVGVLGGLVYRGLGGPADPASVQQGIDVITEVGWPLIVADIVQCIGNAALVAGVIHVAGGAPFRAQLVKLLTGTGAAYVAYGVIALILVILWVPGGVGPFSTVLTLAPLVAARWALTRYGAETEAHERTAGALVAAIEARSPGSAGQSASVAQLSGWIAEQLALTPRQVETAITAGMLHDVGLLVVPAELLSPGHVLSDSELDILRTHPTRSSELMRGIAFLEPSIPGVVHHHERWDGSGYPSGLAGEGIPLIARIVAVADGFAALTSARRDRAALDVGQALTVIRSLAGTAYDPDVVQALTRALPRHPRRPPTAVPLVLLGSAVAHDEPTPLGGEVSQVRVETSEAS